MDFFSISSYVDQEAILRFFNCPDPNIFAGGKEFVTLTPLSTQISIGTLKILVQGLLERYKGGLGLIEIENILFFITFIRFVTLAKKYNIKTSFCICCISLLAGLLWYFHLKDLRRYYGPMLGYNRFTETFVTDMNMQSYLKRGAKVEVTATSMNTFTNLKWVNKNPIKFLKGAFVYSIERDEYRIDPISMFVSNLPEEYKTQGDKIYYKIFENYIPRIYRLGYKSFRSLVPLFLYSNTVRVNKEFCPYLIRWHWTFVLISQTVEGEVTRIVYRLYIYIHQVLIPSGRFNEAGLLQIIFTVVIGVQFCYILLAMLHAVCGQYFYLPFLTENVETHIGKKPQNSIYSGGYTSWQEGLEKRQEYTLYNGVQFTFPRLWWGWLGKNPSLETLMEGQLRTRRKKAKRRKKIKMVRKFIRKLKNWILRS